MSEINSEPMGNGSSESETIGKDRSIQLLDLLVLLARGRDLLIRIVVICLGLGVVYGIVSSPEYKASARVVPESPGEGAQGLGGLSGGISALQGFGINLGSLGQNGLSKDAYPEVLKSREVRLAVVHDTFDVPGTDTTATLVQYFNGESGVISRVKDWGKSVVLEWREGDDEKEVLGEYPTLEEEMAILQVKNMVTSYQDPQSGLMRISVTAGDPKLATEMVSSFLTHLSSRVRTLRTRKARENLTFVEERFEEAEEQLSEAEQELASFVDRNQSITTAELRTKRERLERQVRFKSSLYSELQAQRTQAELDLQRSEPVLTMVEKPVPPLEPVSPQWLLIIVLSLMTGAVVGVGGVLLRAYFSGEDTIGKRRAKLQEVREAFFPKRVVSAVGKRLPTLTPQGNEETTS